MILVVQGTGNFGIYRATLIAMTVLIPDTLLLQLDDLPPEE